MLISYMGDQALLIGWFWRNGKEYVIHAYHHGRRYKVRGKARLCLQRDVPDRRLRIDGVRYV